MRTEGETAALVRCDSYEAEKVQAALDRAVGFLGDMTRFPPGDAGGHQTQSDAEKRSGPLRRGASERYPRGGKAGGGARRACASGGKPGGVYNPAALRASMRLPVCFPWRKRREWS